MEISREEAIRHKHTYRSAKGMELDLIDLKGDMYELDIDISDIPIEVFEPIETKYDMIGGFNPN